MRPTGFTQTRECHDPPEPHPKPVLKSLPLRLLLTVGGVATAPVSAAAARYAALQRHPRSGSDGWDYLSIDAAAHRLFIAHSDCVLVIDQKRPPSLCQFAPSLRSAKAAATYSSTAKAATSAGPARQQNQHRAERAESGAVQLAQWPGGWRPPRSLAY